MGLLLAASLGLLVSFCCGRCALALTDSPEAQAALDNAQATWDRLEDEEALRLFEQVVEDFPDTEQAAGALAMIGLWWKEHGDPTKAFHFWRRAAQDYPGSAGNAEAWRLMAAAAEEQGRHGKALVLWDRIIRTFPGTAEEALARFRRARVRWEVQKHYARAIRDYQRVISLVPDDPLAPEARILLAHNYLWLDDAERALKAYLETMEATPGTALAREAAYYAGVLYVAPYHNDEAALAYFDIALSGKVPEGVRLWALVQRAYARSHLGQFEGAHGDCQALLDTTPPEHARFLPMAHAVLFDVYLREKRYDEAIAEQELILRDYPETFWAAHAGDEIRYAQTLKLLAEGKGVPIDWDEPETSGAPQTTTSPPDAP